MGPLGRLTRVGLRVRKSLGLTTVPRGVVENACALTGARHGSITATDESGAVNEFVLLGSFGPWGLYRYLREHPEPVEFKDLSAHLRERGIASKLPDGFGHGHSLLAAQSRYRGKHGGREPERRLQRDQSLPGRRRSARPAPDSRPDRGLLQVLEYREAVRVGSPRQRPEKRLARRDGSFLEVANVRFLPIQEGEAGLTDLHRPRPAVPCRPQRLRWHAGPSLWSFRPVFSGKPGPSLRPDRKPACRTTPSRRSSR